MLICVASGLWVYHTGHSGGSAADLAAHRVAFEVFSEWYSYSKVWRAHIPEGRLARNTQTAPRTHLQMSFPKSSCRNVCVILTGRTLRLIDFQLLDLKWECVCLIAELKDEASKHWPFTKIQKEMSHYWYYSLQLRFKGLNCHKLALFNWFPWFIVVAIIHQKFHSKACTHKYAFV